ncbi:aromatic acid exporter family protein [Bacillus cereus]|nr:aromatic acid exporter family protein [Bacillus cereus]
MNQVRKWNIVGGRVIKTGIAVFLTVLVCEFFHIPTIFAVITAIVTIEPTATDSIKKGLVRFPASTIGSAYAMTFTFFLGHQALSYALAAVFTIFTCQKLKLHAGTLVATLTAVAMIPITANHYFTAFLIRLATTSTGIIVSTLVNFFILPPHYSKTISGCTEELFVKTANIMEEWLNTLIEEKVVNKKTTQNLSKLTLLLHKAVQFVQYEQKDWKYHRHTKQEMRSFLLVQKQLQLLQQIIYHIDNLARVPIETCDWSQNEKEILQRIIHSIIFILRNRCNKIDEEHFKLIDELDKKFWNYKNDLGHCKPSQYRHHFSSESIILFEVLSIHDMLEELKQISEKYEGENQRNCSVHLNGEG